MVGIRQIDFLSYKDHLHLLGEGNIKLAKSFLKSVNKEMCKLSPDSYCNTCKRHSAVPPFSFWIGEFPPLSSSVQIVSSVVIGSKPICPSIVCPSKSICPDNIYPAASLIHVIHVQANLVVE